MVKDSETELGTDHGINGKSEASKRTRLPSDDAENPVAKRQRHETLWYEDGTVILANRMTLFRVYRGTLARRSLVFKDLFSLPQPVELNAEDTLDGVPVVVLDDSTQDLYFLLKAVFEES